MASDLSLPCRGSNGTSLGPGPPAGKHDEKSNRRAGTQSAPRITKKKAEDESLIAYLCAQICEHQLGISVNLLLLLFLTHIFFPRARRRTSRFFHLSYYDSATQKYGCGSDDLPFVALWFVLFTGLRVFIMDYILGPLARLVGIKTNKGMVRFQEQAWLLCYCTCSWSLGMYIMYHSEYWLDLHGMWRGWPFRDITGLSKFYYLVQWAFWIQQLVVVNIEEKRKDYAQMFTHHIFTSALLFWSYGYYHTRVGTVILCIMDLIDIVLPTAKLLKYMGFTFVCDLLFGAFVLSWLVTRQILYPIVCWSVYAQAPIYIPNGCYFTDKTFVPASNTTSFDALGGNRVWSNLVKAYTDREAHVCWNTQVQWSFLSLLLALQAIIFLWSHMIVKVVYKVVSGQGADDVRSDDEEEDEEIEEQTEIQHISHPINGAMTNPERVLVGKEVGVEALNFAKRRERVNTRSRDGRASGISIPGHGDRKELLGRIGCDKPA